jgi:hypothetical protein
MASDKPIVKFPFGAATVEQLSAEGAQNIEVVNTLTVIDGVTVVATGDRTLNLTPAEDLIVGSELFVKSKTTGTEKLISGNGVTGPEIVGVAGKTIVVQLIYDGSKFIHVSPKNQID